MISTARLTHEVLITLMAEVMTIMNNRPLISMSTDPDAPTVLAPAMIPTQKIEILAVPPGNSKCSRDLPQELFCSFQKKRNNGIIIIMPGREYAAPVMGKKSPLVVTYVRTFIGSCSVFSVSFNVTI